MIRRIVYHRKSDTTQECYDNIGNEPPCHHERRRKAHFVNKQGWTLCQWREFIGVSKQVSHLLVRDSEEFDYATCKWCLKLPPEVLLMEALK